MSKPSPKTKRTIVKHAKAPQPAVHPLQIKLLDAIASYLTSDLGRKSLDLAAGSDDAKDWVKMREAAGVSGYMTKTEAVCQLVRVLGIA